MSDTNNTPSDTPPSPSPDAPKVGLDDFLVAHGVNGRAALLELIERAEVVKEEQGSGSKASQRDAQFKEYQQRMRGEREAVKAAENPSELAVICIQARKRFELFRAPNGVAYASADKVTAFPIEDSTQFSDQLHDIYRQFVSTRGDVASSSLIANAVKGLAAEARLSGVRPVLQRSGWHDGKVYVYRADPAAPSEVLVVSRDGVSTCTNLPMRFAVRPDAGTIPRPAAVGDAEALRPFLNIENPDQFPIVAAWAAAAVVANFPVRLLMVTGEQGTAKSTFAELLLRLIDPDLNPESEEQVDEPLRGAPKDEETLAIAALHSHVLAFDNLSGLSNDMCDLFCRVVTGGMFSTRTKYTTTSETRIRLRRPVIFTGIDLPSFRADLLERMLTVPLKKIHTTERITRRKLFKRFDAVRPVILASLYQLIIRGMNTDIDLGDMSLSRMADFDEFAARAVGRETVEAEMANVDHDNAEEALQAHPFIPTLLDLIKCKNRWRVTAADLLKELEEKFKGYSQHRPFPKRWPGGPHILSGQLKKAAPALFTIHGIRVTKDKDKDSKRTKYLVIENPSAKSEDPFDDLTKEPGDATDGRARAAGDSRTLDRDLSI